jgi:selenocysteine lyase/cysteine desulfurase
MTRRDLGRLMTGALTAAVATPPAIGSPSTRSVPECWRQDFPALRHSTAREQRGVAIRAGDLSALPLLKHFGVREAARASCFLYTTQAEIDEFIEALSHSIALRS